LYCIFPADTTIWPSSPQNSPAGRDCKKPPGFVKAVFEDLEAAIQSAESELEKAGIQKKRITVKLIQGADSRSEAIISAAMEENCDTLVFGRKGRSDVDHFDIGSIPWKAIQGAREMTVWIVP